MCVRVCVRACVCLCIKTTMMANVVWEVTLAGLQISGRDFRNLIGETTGHTGRDLAKSHENTNPEVMIQIQLNIPGIQKWRQ